MGKTIYSIIPDSEVLLELEPEELAGIVLEVLNSLDHASTGQLNRYNFTLQNNFGKYPPQHKKAIGEAVMEAWVWLEREGLIAPKPDSGGEWVFVTRRGQQIRTAKDLNCFRRGNILPKQLLHPIIAQKIWATFLRGEYDTAVFQTFKEVEVAVREAGDFEDTDIGTDLMRKAFDVDRGPLTDQTSPKAEREALAHLFAGSIGSYKNPHSHRKVSIKPEEAVEMIILGSHLLKIVDSKKREEEP